MSYIVIVNNGFASCAINKYILSEEEVYHLSTAENLLEKIKLIKEKEEEFITTAKTEGYDAGYTEGLKKAESEFKKQFLQYLKNLTENVYLNTIENDKAILDLACEVVRKIATEIGPKNMLQSIALTAIQNLKHKKTLEIKVKEVYVQPLEKKIESLKHQDTINLSSIEVKSDDSLGDLDVIIKSESGVTIASFDEQIKLLKQNIEEEMNLAN
jgi:flagellar biosynthesis/type III secretory pathway protein FliH